MRGRIADGFAILLSFLCVVHCIAVPIMLAMAPAFAHFFNWPEVTHGLIVLLAVPASAIAMKSGYRRHRRFVPMLFATAGLILIASGAWGELPHRLEIAITIAGSAMIVVAHVANMREGVREKFRRQKR